MAPPRGQVPAVSSHPQVPLGGDVAQRGDVPPRGQVSGVGGEVTAGGQVMAGGGRRGGGAGGRAAGEVQAGRGEAGGGRGEVWRGDGEVFVHGGGGGRSQQSAPLRTSLKFRWGALCGRSLRRDLDARHGGEVPEQRRPAGVTQEVRRPLVGKLGGGVGGSHGCDGHRWQGVRLRAGGARTRLRRGVAVVVVLVLVFVVHLIAVVLAAVRLVGVGELMVGHHASGQFL